MTILAMCALVFLVVAPYIVFYSMGYRLDFKHMKIVATGGIYVHALPSGTDIIIDKNIDTTTGYFNNSVFVQNLQPGQHQVVITKAGYYTYQKKLGVQEKQVTKLESVTLFKQNLAFTALDTGISYLSFAPDNTTLLLAKLTTTGTDIEILNTSNQQQQTYHVAGKKGQIAGATWSGDSKKVLLKIAATYYLVDTTAATLTVDAISALTGASQVAFNPQNSQEFFFIKNSAVYSSLQLAPLTKTALAFFAQPGTSSIIWLGANGSLNTLNTATLQTGTYLAQPLPIQKGVSYNIKIVGDKVFVQENATLWLADKTTDKFIAVYPSVKDLRVSPDNQKIVYFNNNEVVISPEQANVAPATSGQQALVPIFSGTVSDVWWLNNDYIVIASGNNIIISEIDARGNVNTITLPSTISASGGQSVALQNPQIFFSQQDKKLYILSQASLIVSEKLLP